MEIIVNDEFQSDIKLTTVAFSFMKITASKITPLR